MVHVVVNVNNFKMLFADVISCSIVVFQNELHVILLEWCFESCYLFNIQSFTIANLVVKIVSHLFLYPLDQISTNYAEDCLSLENGVLFVEDSEVFVVMHRRHSLLQNKWGQKSIASSFQIVALSERLIVIIIRIFEVQVLSFHTLH